MADQRIFGPGPHRLLCDGRDVAPLEVAETAGARGRGLLGTHGIDGALWITRCPSVHMIGMRYPIDVAAVDRDGRVLKIKTLKPWTGGTHLIRGAVATIEAGAGALRLWGVVEESRLAIQRSGSTGSPPMHSPPR